MKNYLKKLTIMGLLLSGILLVVTNCESESVIVQDAPNSVLSEQGKNDHISTGKLSDFKKLNSFVTRIQNEYHNDVNRLSIEDDNGFTILEDREIYVYTDTTSTAYTMAIEKDNHNTLGFSNLVVKFSNDGSTTAFILNYVPSQEYLNAYVLNDQIPFQGTINYESINYDGSLDNLNDRIKCNTITLTYCNYGGEVHSAGENCSPEYMFDVTYEICYETTGNAPLNESIDPPSGPGGGGGSNGKSNATNPLTTDTCEDSSGNIGLTGSNGDCYTSEAINFVEELEAIVGENNYEFDNTLSDYEVISFDTLDEFESFHNSIFNDLTIEPQDIQNENGITETKVFNHMFNLYVFSYNMQVEVDVTMPSESSCECIEIEDVNTILYGNTTIVDWEEIGEHTTQISADGDNISVFTRGKMTIGVKILGYPVEITYLVTFVQVFKYSTGIVSDYYMIKE